MCGENTFRSGGKEGYGGWRGAKELRVRCAIVGSPSRTVEKRSCSYLWSSDGLWTCIHTPSTKQSSHLVWYHPTLYPHPTHPFPLKSNPAYTPASPPSHPKQKSSDPNRTRETARPNSPPTAPPCPRRDPPASNSPYYSPA